VIEKKSKNQFYMRDRDTHKSFIRNTISRESEWIQLITSIIVELQNTSYKLDFDSVIKDTATIQKKLVNACYFAKNSLIDILRSIRSEIELYTTTQYNDKPKPITNKVFIVHGHNEAMKLAVDKTISKLGLSPIILHEQPNRGRTIIEKFERLSEDINFAIVLLSADDEMKDGIFRARQSVILELGYFIAKLGRENVVALYDNVNYEIELPSDVSGILYVPYDKPDGGWRNEVVQELKAAGFEVDANLLM
jgi:predicted nucleotide-binding protein